jgi:ElaA protein
MIDHSALQWSCKPFAALSVAELYQILHWRQRVFVVEQTCAYLDADGLDPECLHLSLCNPNGELLAYARLLPPGLNGVEPAIGRVLVVPQYRRQGLARLLMSRALSETTQRFASMSVRVSAQLYLQGFYQSLGFVVAGAPYDEDGIAHIDMLQSLT